MSKPHASKVEEIERLFGDRQTVMRICGIEQRSAISNWKNDGIPRAHKLALVSVARRDGIKFPEWLLDVDEDIERRVPGALDGKALA